jgi:precorrin-6A synthase
MRQVSIIGIGAGNPDYLTIQAVAAIRQADVFFIPDKGEDKSALKAVREEMLARHGRAGRRLVEFAVPERDRTGAYGDGVADWRGALSEAYRELVRGLGEGERGAFLVWGDPALYDGTISIVQEIQGVELEVIPGISAVQALAARHRIALNRVGEAVTITTARRVRAGEADGLSSFVVMLDSEAGWKRFISEEDTEIFWGGYLGMGEEILLAGRVCEVAGEIERVRAEARARNGWIMDTYLIRRRV